jgi:8-oxo-dGTP pyrophosphatase MutT (NUDIX family)
MSEVQPIRPAATVILVREAPSSFEIFMLRRTSKAAFAGGMYVFPGGRVDGDDHLHSLDQHRQGPSQAQKQQQQALGDEWRGYWIAGIRESFEEAGLLLAYREDGSLLEYRTPEEHARYQAYRSPLHSGSVGLREICEAEKLKLAVDRIHFYNRFVTPLGRPRRFDTRFFVAETPEGQVGRHDDFETVDSVWISPQQALAQHAEEAFGLMNVTRMQLEALAQHPTKRDLINACEARSDFPIHRPVLPRS